MVLARTEELFHLWAQHRNRFVKFVLRRYLLVSNYLNRTAESDFSIGAIQQGIPGRLALQSSEIQKVACPPAAGALLQKTKCKPSK